MSKPVRSVTRILLAIQLLFVGIQGARIAQDPELSLLLSVDHWVQLAKISQIMRAVKVRHVDGEGLSFKKQADCAIQGVLSSVDPYSTYYSAEEFKAFNTRIGGGFVGIGVELECVEGALMLVGILPKSPAQEAGLKIGDRIVGIEGVNVEKESCETVFELLKGSVGMPVEVFVWRHSSRETVRAVVQRQHVSVPQVSDVGHLSEDIGYVKISQFWEGVTEQFRKAVVDLKQSGIKALIIDLRGNPGGYLEYGVRVANLLLDNDKTIVSVKDKSVDPPVEYKARNMDFLKGIPIAILVDGDTASASEILAGSLQDHHRAVIVGEVSYGKGSVQEIFELEDGSGFKLTTALYYLPSGRTVHNKGIEPDIAVDLPENYHQLSWMHKGSALMPDRTFSDCFGVDRLPDPFIRKALSHFSKHAAPGLSRQPDAEEATAPEQQPLLVEPLE